MRAAELFLLIILVAGCVAREPAPGKAPSAAPAKSKAVAVEPPRTEAPKGEAVTVEPAAPPVSPPAPDVPAPGAPEIVPPAAKAPPRVPAPAEQVRKKDSVAPAPAKKPAAPPPLDLDSLEKRLRETEAIGVFTKLTLKNQVDDLLDRFRAHYQGRIKTTLAELRQPYDLLILKVLTLLQDGDPPLANAILASREAIWGILSDPKKFSTLDKQATESK